jgi:hypothetical protein
MLKSVPAAVMLSQAIYWQQRVPKKRPIGCPGPNWWHHSIEEWEDETALTRNQQATARKILCKRPFWYELRRGVPARLWFLIDFNSLENVLTQYLRCDSPSSRMLDSDNLDSYDSEDLIVEDSQSSMLLDRNQDYDWQGDRFPDQQQTLSEITTETTTETTTNHLEAYNLNEHIVLIKNFELHSGIKNPGAYLRQIRDRIMMDGPSSADKEQIQLLRRKRKSQVKFQEELKKAKALRKQIDSERDDPVKFKKGLGEVKKLSSGKYF